MALLRVVLKPPTIINDELEYKIPHETMINNHLIYLLAYLRIVNVITDCSGSTITVEVAGGKPPYQYSYDNGLTFTSPTSSTGWTFSIDSGGTYNILVADSDNQTYAWDEITCNALTITFEPVYLTSYSVGYITDENDIIHTSSFGVIQNYLDIYSVSATTASGTSFLGWSLYKPTRYTYKNYDKLSTNSSYSHEARGNITIYGLFLNDGPVVIDIDQYPTTSGYTATNIDKQYYCTSGNTGSSGSTITIFFNKDDYEMFGIENIPWYLDEALTIPVPDGYYKLNSPNSPMYQLLNGDAGADGNCNGPDITCLT